MTYFGADFAQFKSTPGKNLPSVSLPGFFCYHPATLLATTAATYEIRLF
jgi:hypothetical protein